MHLHIIGICGTFMAGLALIARELGHRVTGSDQNVYPPMSGVLDRAGITPISGYDPAQLSPAPDAVVIGNAMVRGNPCVEHILDQGEMQRFERLLAVPAAGLQEALLYGARGGQQKRSRAAGGVAHPQARKRIGVRPVRRRGPMLGNGEFGQQHRRRRAGIERAVVTRGFEQLVVERAGMVQLQPANMRDAVQHGIDKIDQRGLRAVIGRQNPEHRKRRIDNRPVIDGANTPPVIVKKPLLVGSVVNVQKRLKAVDGKTFRMQAVLQQRHIGENQAGNARRPRVAIRLLRLPGKLQGRRQLLSDMRA